MALTSLSLLAAGFAGACSASPGGNTSFFGSNSTGTGNSGTGASGSGGSSGSSGLGGDTGFDGGFATGAGGSGSAGTGGSATCAATPYTGMQLPLDMYIIQDQSASMSDTVSEGGTKWQAVTTAFNAFVAQPGLTGISVGIQYFGVPPGGGAASCGCNSSSDCTMPGDFCLGGMCFECSLGSAGGDSCSAADYAKPEVEIAALPGVAAAITASLAKHSPSTSTPTGPALQGALDHAKAWATAHPGHATIAVLATDGEPNECSPTDQAGIAAIAAAALAGTPSIKTFTIGTFATADIPSGPNLLNAVAAAGGTGQAFNIDTTTNVNQAFLAALNSIRGTALGCQYSIPAPTGGADPTKLNVQYTPGGGGKPEIIGNVATQAQCPANGDGWYYDNNAKPTLILLCGSTCTKVSGDATGKVDILLGCKTMTSTAN